mmetsp:Transcript_32467/g.52238  ORF Transcript_32467/g.52238 Transcript_32467/m.52238 type:complete len:205 (-) Transcript_32467:415-1029(-)
MATMARTVTLGTTVASPFRRGRSWSAGSCPGPRAPRTLVSAASAAKKSLPSDRTTATAASQTSQTSLGWTQRTSQQCLRLRGSNAAFVASSTASSARTRSCSMRSSWKRICKVRSISATSVASNGPRPWVSKLTKTSAVRMLPTGSRRPCLLQLAWPTRSSERARSSGRGGRSERLPRTRSRRTPKAKRERIPRTKRANPKQVN